MAASEAHTFESEHEVVERVHVLLAGLGIVLLDIFVDGPLHDVDGALGGSVSAKRGRGGAHTSKLLALAMASGGG